MRFPQFTRLQHDLQHSYGIGLLVGQFERVSALPTTRRSYVHIRQYLPKRRSMAHITQRHCNRIARKLNTRPRKRLGFLTPEECYENKL